MTRHTAGAFLCVQVAAVLQYAAEKAIESFLPVVLELLASLLEADRKALSSQQPGAHVALVTIMADSYSDVPHMGRVAGQSDCAPAILAAQRESHL